MENNALLIGTGPMAVAYSEVLKALGYTFEVIGRGAASAEKFEVATGIKPVVGGLENYLVNKTPAPGARVIVATGTEGLLPSLLQLTKAEVAGILIEKPAAISIQQLLEHEHLLAPCLSRIFVAYNRRFFTSVIEAERMIEEDGGLQSMQFEFTEWAHRIEPLEKAEGVKENWFFANSTHVVDLAFFLAGRPASWSCYSKGGKIKWHEKTNFSGAGITDKNVLFSYLSNWESAGRWSIELLTDKRRIYLKPIEGISVQLKGTIPVIDHLFDDSIDKLYKPGLYKQVEAFFLNDDSRLINLEEHVRNCKHIYLPILA